MTDFWLDVAVKRWLLAPKDVQISHQGICQCAFTGQHVCGWVFPRGQTFQLGKAPENELSEIVLCQAMGVYVHNKN